MKQVLVLGTRNRKKCREIAEILDGLTWELHDLTSYPEAPEVVEDGATFEANARKKATKLAASFGAMGPWGRQWFGGACDTRKARSLLGTLCRHSGKRRSQ